MKFLYEYRTSDNARHDGAICAASRDAAYVALKLQGIKPSRLVEAPGVFNKLFGKGKRWIAIALLAAVSLALFGVVMVKPSDALLDSFDSTMRRQPLGDMAFIDQGIRTGWAEVFNLEGDRFLASFAIPGVPAGVRNTSAEEIEKALDRDVPTVADDSIEARQIKAMVRGLKDELREFIKDGGSVQQYGRRLVQRQEEELGYYRRAMAEIDRLAADKSRKQELSAALARHNAALRRMGIRPIVLGQ